MWSLPWCPCCGVRRPSDRRESLVRVVLVVRVQAVFVALLVKSVVGTSPRVHRCGAVQQVMKCDFVASVTGVSAFRMCSLPPEKSASRLPLAVHEGT